jgi:hypothetical protein
MTRAKPGAVAAGTVAAFAFLACLRKINGLDYWTHLAFGRVFVSAGTLLVGEPFVERGALPPPPVTTFGRLLDVAVSTSEWPFQIGVYAVQRLAGHAGVSLAIACCGAAAAALLASVLRRETSVGRAAAAAAFASAAFYVARFRFAPRPEAAAAVLLAAVLLLAFRWVERPRWRLLAGILAIGVVWRPLHVTWTLGAAFAGAAIAGGPWRELWRRQPLALRVATAGAALLALVPAARFGWFVVRELRGGMLEGVTEMRPTWEFPSVLWPFAALAAAGLALAWGGRERRPARLAVWAVAVVLGTIVVRNVAFAALALIPAALDGLASAPARAPRAAGLERVYAGAAAAVVVGLLALVLRDRDQPFGVGADWRQYPLEAAEYVRATPLETPVFNSWDWGGYLDWAWNGQPRTFLDGRLFDRQTMAEHDAVIGPAPAAALARRGFRTVLLQPLFRNSGRLVPAVTWFLGSPEWRLVHARDGLVFARVPLPAGAAEVSPGEAWRAVLRFAAVVKEQNDPPLHADYTRAIALLELGDGRGARAAFDDARRVAPALAAGYSDLAWVLGGSAGGLAR